MIAPSLATDDRGGGHRLRHHPADAFRALRPGHAPQLQRAHGGRGHVHQRLRLRAGQRQGGQCSHRRSGTGARRLLRRAGRALPADGQGDRRDGEGATKLLDVSVEGAPSEDVALDLAKACAGSSLVRKRPSSAPTRNWGAGSGVHRCPAGTAGYAIDPADARVMVQDVAVYDRAPLAYDSSVLKARMREPEIRSWSTCAGRGQGTGLGCDLSYDYVKINADYTSLIVTKPDGGGGQGRQALQLQPHLQGEAAGRRARVHQEVLRHPLRESSTAARPW